VSASPVFVWRDRAVAQLRSFFTATTHPVNLAVFRIVVFAVVLLRTWEADPVGVARALEPLPTELMYPPRFIGAVWPQLPLSDTSITVAGLALVGGAAAALVGVCARTSALVCAIAMTYLMAAPNYFGKVNHDHHHLIWFALLLAASPAADALSVRRIRQVVAARRSRQDPPPLVAAVRYALPLRLTWLTLGSLYLFAGLAKLGVGIDWVRADNLRHHLWLHWHTSDWLPPVRFDQWDPVLVAAAAATIIVETGFLFAMFLPRARAVLAVAGFAFHLAVRWLFRITHFWTLQAAYVTFIDWHSLANHLRPHRAPIAAANSSRRDARLLVGGTAVVAAVFLAGAAQAEDGWPFAQYPSFGFVQEPTDSELYLEVVFTDGRRTALEPAPAFTAIGPARYRFLALRSLGEPDPVERDKRLRAMWSITASGRDLASVAEIRAYRLSRPIDPERWSELPTRDQVGSFRPDG
jgi:hypothetical protein